MTPRTANVFFYALLIGVPFAAAPLAAEMRCVVVSINEQQSLSTAIPVSIAGNNRFTVQMPSDEQQSIHPALGVQSVAVDCSPVDSAQPELGYSCVSNVELTDAAASERCEALCTDTTACELCVAEATGVAVLVRLAGLDDPFCAFAP